MNITSYVQRAYRLFKNGGMSEEDYKKIEAKAKEIKPTVSIVAKGYDPCNIVSFGLGGYHRNHKGKWIHR